MLIECLVRREEPIVVPIGNEKYAFDEDEHGRRICEVWVEDHIECFLAVPHLYREAPELGRKPEAPERRPALVINAPAETMAPLDGMKRREIMAELKQRDVKFLATVGNGELRALLHNARRA